MIIKSFEIFDLFGTDTVHIPFDSKIKILIGENGLGKTQVLNLFYYTLTQNFFKLSEFNFSKLRISFSNDKIVEISKLDVDKLTKQIYKHPIVKDLISTIGVTQFERFRNIFLHDKNKLIRNEDNYIYGNSKIGRRVPMHHIIRVFEELDNEERNFINSDLEECKKNITVELKKLDILYFPTYRRVEEDLQNLGYNEDDLNLNQENTLIQFGMEDVKKRFNTIENKIDRLLKEGLAQFTKDILNVVIDESETKHTNKDILDKINQGDIDLILSRIGDQLPLNQKESVKSIVANKTLKNPLSAYLLQKLIEIYEKQKTIDESVKVFRDACNNYLKGKKVFYDESAIKIYIKSERTNGEIDLKSLSSGEKQIISMLSKVYLSDSNKRFIILFDEPELSLSMLWQKKLLPDILNSKKCEFLFAVTHSPFIFENDLDSYAVGLSEYIKTAPALIQV